MPATSAGIGEEHRSIADGITLRKQGRGRDLIQAIPETAWSPIPYWIAGGADVAEIAYTPFRDKKDAVSFRRHRVPLKTLIGLVGTQPELAG